LVGYEEPYGCAFGLSAESDRATGAMESGDGAALAELTPLVYKELRRLAHRHMGGERPNHTLQKTALVNETYLRGLTWAIILLR
jgi:ECF sigma factor